MHDPAELYLPHGQSIVVDLEDLRSMAPEVLASELATNHASWRVAAALWSRSYGDHRWRQFFLTAAEDRTGFGIRHIDPLTDALSWLQDAGAVLRWHEDDDGVPCLRISAHDNADEIFCVIRRACGEDRIATLISAAADLEAELTAHGLRRRLTVVT